MLDADGVIATYEMRRRHATGVRAGMFAVREAYNGSMRVPVEGAERPGVANLVQMGVDQTAGRVASVMPDIIVPPLKNNDIAQRRAQRRKDIWNGWWDHNRMRRQLRRRARYLVAYGMAPVIMGVDFEKKCPRWQVVNPLRVLAPPDDDSDVLVPDDLIVELPRTVGWVTHRYPQVAGYLKDYSADHMLTLVQHMDAEQISLVLHLEQQFGRTDAILLEMMPNRVGEPLATLPRRPVLDHVQGQFDQMLGMYEAQARLTALSIIATEKSVFPDTYLVSNPGDLAEFVDGPYDGRTGKVNVVRGGSFQEGQSGPGYNTNPMLDRLERGQRLSGGVPAEFGGESTTNIRTGRRGDAVLSAAVDFPLAEAQDTLAEALAQENRIAAKLAVAYFGNQELTVRRTIKGTPKVETFRPKETFVSVENDVSYPASGSDINQLVVSMGQRVGLGTMSRETATELDPLIENPERERDRVQAEQLDTAVMASIQQAAQAGQIPPPVVAKVAELVRYDKMDVAKAVEKAMTDYAEQQQRQQMQQQAEMSQLPVGESMPSVAEAPQGMQNLAGMLRTLRNTSTYDAYQGGTGQPIRRGPDQGMRE
jgi:hypothetical protein